MLGSEKKRTRLILHYWWLQQNFTSQFLNSVVGANGKLVAIPPGAPDKRIDETNTEPPFELLSPSLMRVKYQQWSYRSCVLASFASCLYLFGMNDESRKLIDENLPLIVKNEYTVNQFQILTNFVQRHCKGFTLVKVKNIDILNSRSRFPTLFQLIGNDGSQDHCISILGDEVIDSSSSHTLSLCKESLDWCCGRLGWSGKIKRCLQLATI